MIAMVKIDNRLNMNQIYKRLIRVQV